MKDSNMLLTLASTLEENMKKDMTHLNEIKKTEMAFDALEKRLLADRSKSRLRKGAILAAYIAAGAAVGLGAGAAAVMLAPVTIIGIIKYLVLGSTTIVGGVLTELALHQISNRKTLKLKEEQHNLINKKIELINKSKEKDDFHFEFNRKSELYPNEVKYQDKASTEQSIKIKEKIKDYFGPIVMTPAILKSLKTALRTQSRNSIENRLSLKTIDISDANLSEKQLKELLAAGLGNFNTEILILNNNNLDNSAIAKLKQCIVNHKISFQKLKRLELRGNLFNEEALNDIAEIVKHLNLQHLDISNNNLCELHHEEARTKDIMNTTDFLSRQSSHMPSLKILNLENIGLKDPKASAAPVAHFNEASPAILHTFNPVAKDSVQEVQQFVAETPLSKCGRSAV